MQMQMQMRGQNPATFSQMPVVGGGMMMRPTIAPFGFNQTHNRPLMPAGPKPPHVIGPTVIHPTVFPGPPAGTPEGHKEWNSDDEDIDEFGRVKRKAVSTPTAGEEDDLALHKKAKLEGSDNCTRNNTLEEECAKATEIASSASTSENKKTGASSTQTTGRPKGKKNELSAKQRAALERLH